MQQHWTCSRCSVANQLSAPTCVGCGWTAKQEPELELEPFVETMPTQLQDLAAQLVIEGAAEPEPVATAVPTQLQDLAAQSVDETEPVHITEPEAQPQPFVEAASELELDPDPDPDPDPEPEPEPEPEPQIRREEQEPAIEPVAEPELDTDAVPEPMLEPVLMPCSGRRRSGRFFDELDSWIDAAPRVLSRGDGYDELHRRLTTVVRSHGWSHWVVGRSDDGSGAHNILARILVTHPRDMVSTELASSATTISFSRTHCVNAHHSGLQDNST